MNAHSVPEEKHQYVSSLHTVLLPHQLQVSSEFQQNLCWNDRKSEVISQNKEIESIPEGTETQTPEEGSIQ